MARSPLRDGWRVLMRAPVAMLTEIAWRWTFGITFWAVLYYSFREYFASVEISRGEYTMMRTLEPFTLLAVTARVMVAFLTGLRMVGPIIIPALVILWVALATLGRTATIRAFSHIEPRTNWFSSAGLQLFRVVLTFASILAYFGAGILIDTLVGDPTRHFAAVFLLGFLVLLVIALIWSVTNWFVSLAAIFTSRDGRGFFGALSDSLAFYRRRSDSFVSAGFGFGFLRALLVIAATVLSVAPFLRFSATHMRMAIVVVVVVTLVYMALADVINLWRLAFYVGLSEPEPELPVVAAPEPAIQPEPGPFADAGFTSSEQTGESPMDGAEPMTESS